MSVKALRASSLPGRGVRVVLADGKSLFRASLRHLLSVPPPVIKEVYGVDVGLGFQVVGEAGTGEETVSVVQSVKSDLLLLNPSLPRMSGFEALQELEAYQDSLRTILLVETMDRAYLLRAVHLGVRGVVQNDAPTELLFEAILCVLSGRCWLEQTLVTDLIELVRPLIQSSRGAGGKLAFGLTARELEVLTMVTGGYSNKEIAEKCAVSKDTVKHHLTRVFKKVGASKRLELAALAARSGLESAV